MADILQEILAALPQEAEVTSCSYEGANIIIYTKSKDFFLDNKGTIRALVNNFKKRIELRPDPSLTIEMEPAEELIKKIIPEEANVDQIIFDPQRSIVIIEAEKPGKAIGKNGEVLKEIKEKTTWVPVIKRKPALRSKIIENIRHVLYENNDFRKKFLNDVGKRIYSGWIRGKKDSWVRLTVLGAGREVGRSCFLLQTPESRVLLDCGLDPSKNGEEMYPHFDSPDFKLNEIDAVIVSHSHLDHSCMVPLLFKYGYKGPVYCTPPTRDIMSLLALDFINIGLKEARDDLYSTNEVKDMVKHTITLDYGEVTDITPDIRITMYNAGHVLGSAMVHLHIGNGLHNLLYTADMNYETSNLLAPAVTKFPRLESMIIESTYGGKDDNPPSRKECEDELIKIVKKTIEDGGKVLLPVLGVGRSQEIMLILEKMMRTGIIPQVKVYIQGLVWDITAIHTAYPDYFSSAVKRAIFQQGKNPFLSDIFVKVGSWKEMQEVKESGEPCIIVATSGMMIGGASVEYFKSLAENPKNSLILTCYQAPNTLGRRLEQGEREISFAVGGGRSDVTKVRCSIHAIHGFSGHSSRKQLMNYLQRLDPRPRKLIVQHGESHKCIDLASSAHKALRIETLAPKNLEALRLR